MQKFIFDSVGHILHRLAWAEWAVRQVQPIRPNLRWHKICSSKIKKLGAEPSPKWRYATNPSGACCVKSKSAPLTASPAERKAEGESLMNKRDERQIYLPRSIPFGHYTFRGALPRRQSRNGAKSCQRQRAVKSKNWVVFHKVESGVTSPLRGLL